MTSHPSNNEKGFFIQKMKKKKKLGRQTQFESSLATEEI
jgi:hypothetical protein